MLLILSRLVVVFFTLATFNELVFDRWWTDTTLSTDANGRVSLDGFYGDDEVEVAPDRPLYYRIRIS